MPFRSYCCLLVVLTFSPPLFAQSSGKTAWWSGTLTNTAGDAIAGATLQFTSGSVTQRLATTDAHGAFRFELPMSSGGILSVESAGRQARMQGAFDGSNTNHNLRLMLSEQGVLTAHFENDSQARTGGGEELSSRTVSAIPLNKRDFSQLLLLAAGTMTDSNGATNFTQQFAINGQRGVEATFAMDGADTSDPEMGGATFSNFNVDAVSEIRSSSGWMPAAVGRGAAGFTDVITRSGADGFHGSVFEFVRNSAFDARNYFDRRSPVNPDRIPPFRRNEFGFTNGGPVRLPGLYDGRGRTFYFVEYQGFRQVLGTTQVFPVPTASERSGLDTTAFPGDTLFVPVNSRMGALINRYPVPNDLGGPYGEHTYATSSKVTTDADQFSVRIDQKISKTLQLFGRFSIDNLSGPTTNPDQTALDPSFGIRYNDHQRNAALSLTKTATPNLVFESALSYTRTTPSFPTPNRTDPALTFSDGLFEGFNTAAGSVTVSYANLFQGRETISWTRGKHAWKFGAEFRANRDTSYFGTAVNGSYTFGGGTAYAPVAIRSASGAHDLAAGAPLPDTLSALLTASPFAYTLAVAPAYFPQGDQIGVAAVSRYGVNGFFEDTWKISDRLVLDYGVRYEVYTPISERAKRAASLATREGANGRFQEYLINPQPRYRLDWKGVGPRARLTWRAAKDLELSAGGGLTTVPPNIWQDNFLTGSTPFVIYPRITAAPGSAVPFGVPITPQELPEAYTPAGQNIFATRNTGAVPANTVLDIDRFERGIAALNPTHQITPINTNTISQDFRNSYLGTWTAALEKHFGGLDASAAYIGTAGVMLPAVNFPNGYPGASPVYAPFTQFDASGAVTGGFGTEMLITNRSHSTYHGLQTSLQGNVGTHGPALQASYTWSKSLDDTSSVTGGFIAGASGALAQAWPQDPFHTSAEKGPSTFDVRQAFNLSIIQDLHVDSVSFLRPLSRKLTAGWQLLSVTTLTSGLPFTIYSGVQQTAVGSNGVDRPDQIGTPHLSTDRKIREDYFGLADQNATYFAIPSGRFGSLGRDTFRGPALHNFDFGVIKDTPFGTRGNGELVSLQFRSEFFNLFNLVNFGLPANIIKGSGFGEISRTAANSRQIQFSLKLLF